MNRRIISSVADYHFCPTVLAFSNLKHERKATKNAWIVGNTAIDALQMVEGETDEDLSSTAILTLHRRESWGSPMIATLEAIIEWLDSTDMKVLWPVHPNPVVRGIAKSFDHSRLIKVDAMDYFDFVRKLKKCKFIITDSGGMQEEAAFLGKYVVVTRDKTERREGVDFGIAKRVGPTEKENIVESLLEAESIEIEASTIYGDGKASERILKVLTDKLRLTVPGE